MKIRKQLSKKLFLAAGIVWFCAGYLHAQSLDQAKKMYSEGKYDEAKPAFEKLVKQTPSNASYNLWYGVCCYETGDLETAEKHLSVAVKRRVIDAYRYMGDLCYKTYRFEKAIEMYEDYIDLRTKKKQPVEDVEAKLDLADNALRLMEKVEDVQVIDSVVVDRHDFVSAYQLSEECGSIQLFQDFFQTVEPQFSTVYQNQKGDMIYYAHPVDSGRFELFSQSRLMDRWGDERLLTINREEKADNNYPFVLSDGVTLYFASKGNGSLGGYDLFVTRYNTSSDAYLAPEQLGMPFNSPYNDYLLVIDEVKGLGWFVTDRFQPADKVCVYLFIPNEEHGRIETEDTEFKRSRARILSIRDSWKPQADYTEQIALAHQAIPFGKEEVKRDFTFVVNDQITYYTLEEIRSKEARNYYEKLLAVKKQIRALNNKLDDLRMAWHKAGAAKREQLKPTILAAEAQLNDCLSQLDPLEKNARNSELIYLKKKS